MWRIRLLTMALHSLKRIALFGRVVLSKLSTCSVRIQHQDKKQGKGTITGSGLGAGSSLASPIFRSDLNTTLKAQSISEVGGLFGIPMIQK